MIWMILVCTEDTLKDARLSSEPPWCSAVRRLMVNKRFTTFAFAVPLLQSVRLREKDHGHPMEGRVGQSERYVGSFRGSAYQRQPTCLWPLPCQTAWPCPCTMRPRSPLFLLIRHDRCSTSSFGRIGRSETALQRATMPSCHGHADDCTCQSRWLSVATPHS